MTIGQKLTEARGTERQSVVADAVGISVSALSNYENDTRVPRDEIKIKLANYYGKSVQELFFCKLGTQIVNS